MNSLKIYFLLHQLYMKTELGEYSLIREVLSC